jgi:hypothetical protein
VVIGVVVVIWINNKYNINEPYIYVIHLYISYRTVLNAFKDNYLKYENIYLIFTLNININNHSNIK